MRSSRQIGAAEPVFSFYYSRAYHMKQKQATRMHAGGARRDCSVRSNPSPVPAEAAIAGSTAASFQTNAQSAHTPTSVMHDSSPFNVPPVKDATADACCKQSHKARGRRMAPSKRSKSGRSWLEPRLRPRRRRLQARTAYRKTAAQFGARSADTNGQTLRRAACGAP